MTIQELKKLLNLLSQYHFEYHDYNEPTTFQMINMINDSIENYE